MIRTTNYPSFRALALLCILDFTAAQESALKTKRGLAYLGDTHQGDTNLLLSTNSSIAWYYTWSANPATDINTTLPFVPLLHGLDDASSDDVMGVIADLPASSTHLLTFNEPDGTTSSGGSSISASDAAKAYINDIAPLRTGGPRTWNISHPSVTGSQQGLDWLREFNETCYDIDPDSGCPTDFVAVHWYGDFAGLSAWLGTLEEFYVTNGSAGAGDLLQFWITEMALPSGGEDDTLAMMNQSMAYLDGLDYVQGYAWFGAFREGGGANEWTGDSVALFSGKGALTDVGALYLGGEARGFTEGMTGGSSGADRLRLSMCALVVAGFALVASVC